MLFKHIFYAVWDLKSKDRWVRWHGDHSHMSLEQSDSTGGKHFKVCLKKISVWSLIEYEEEEEEKEEEKSASHGRLFRAAEVMWLHVGSAVCHRRFRSRGDPRAARKNKWWGGGALKSNPQDGQEKKTEGDHLSDKQQLSSHIWKPERDLRSPPPFPPLRASLRTRNSPKLDSATTDSLFFSLSLSLLLQINSSLLALVWSHEEANLSNPLHLDDVLFLLI